jgi:serine/threonine-protein kinase
VFPPEAVGPEPFGKYLLDREIARGGMARVHLARLRGLGGFEKRLVVKQILPHLARDPRFVAMFVEEAKTLVQMSHPHIVPVYELGVVDGIYFLAMEYVEGATLADVLEDGTLDAAQVAHVGAQICDALSYAHERFGIVHRDVTPRNVIVDGAGHCRLLDFGIAARASSDGEGVLFGTPGYVSPEQARGEHVGPASDLFGLGAVLWHAWIGEPPFDLRSVEGVRALRPGSLERPRLASREGLDAELAAIVDRALDPDPAARPHSARALGRSLRSWLAARHPEDVAFELGVRAERARARCERRASLDRPASPASAPRGDATGTVRTLAQSRALAEILGGTAKPDRTPCPSAPHAAAPAAPAAPDPASSAAPDPASSTVPIVGRSGRHEILATPRNTKAAAERAVTERAGKASLVRPLAIGTLAAIAVFFAWNAEPREPEPDFPRPRPIANARTERATLDKAPAPARLTGEAGARVPPIVAAPHDAPQAEGPVPGPDPRPPAPADSAPDPAGGAASSAISPAARAPAGPNAARRARSARIAITARGWAEITIDGQRIGTTPVREHRIAPGRHVLVARNPTLASGEARAWFEAEPNASLHALVDFDAPIPIAIGVRP